MATPALRGPPAAGYHSSVRIRHSSFDARQHRDQPAEPEARLPRDQRPSKSQLKREMTALQDLGEELMRLPQAKLRELPLPEKLYEAIELAQRIRDREGLRRQRQYIGKLMRDVDAAPLRDALSKDGAGHRAEVAAMHGAERWRERLLAEPGAAAAFRAAYPEVGPQLEELIEGARAEASAPQNGRRYRQLFRFVRDTLLEAAAAPAADKAEAAPPSEAP